MKALRGSVIRLNMIFEMHVVCDSMQIGFVYEACSKWFGSYQLLLDNGMVCDIG